MISWSSKKQSSIAQSTVEAKYITASNTSREVVWLRKLLSGLFQERLETMLRFGYLGKWSPCAYESLSTKGEDYYPHTLLYDSNFTLT
jgi:hypothetical protein